MRRGGNEGERERERGRTTVMFLEEEEGIGGQLDREGRISVRGKDEPSMEVVREGDLRGVGLNEQRRVRNDATSSVESRKRASSPRRERCYPRHCSA